MNIYRLVIEGEDIKNEKVEISEDGPIGYGRHYKKWIMKSIIFMEKKYPASVLTKRLIEISENALKNDIKYLEDILLILKAVKETEQDDEEYYGQDEPVIV
ncbi:hypothetical protein [Tepidibacter aestuarii]|uniref:hypothetical protein n=1 Tax=Tepidibacter aestuarii TaxID=2925782 RepID=UPI0020C00211|nr:hypothetical protein [Tepidibacter aestuarii]CAH2213247.1 protein of unknown function [Tepidibacter aestuarii]